MRCFWLLLGLFSILLVGCSTDGVVGSGLTESLLSTPTLEAGINSTSPFIPITNTPLVDTPIITKTPTLSPSATVTLVPTDFPVPAVTRTHHWNPASEVTTPILLYHHVSNDDPDNRYYVTLKNFRAQLQVLRDWGYTTITASSLADVIVHGGNLPAKPVVITFDDGYQDIFQNAYPIMQEMGFIGVIYIYVEQVGLNGFVNDEQIKTLVNNGWEIGCHSMSHIDLTRNHSKLAYEVQESQTTLQETYGVKVDTFAYPYGKSDKEVIEYVKNTNYVAGMGLGLNWRHTLDSIFDLSRIEIRSDINISSFKNLLPWFQD